MKQIIRRLTALALCAILMMAMPLASAQELTTPEGGLLTVQIVITQPDGTMSLLPVTPVTNTMGNTVYWVHAQRRRNRLAVHGSAPTGE